ncbi:MAG TPA: hypothetical protein VF472_21915 [Burkholderiaceae bacterium]
MNPDPIESALLLGAAYISFRSALRIYTSRSIDGVYWPAWFYYMAYEAWRFPYYWTLGQPLSIVINALMFSTNFIAIAGFVRIYRNKNE